VFGQRLQLALLVFISLLAVCIGKLAQLQLWDHSKYALAALSSLTREELVPSERGRVLDIDGRVLAEDVPSFDLSVVPSELAFNEVTIGDLKIIREIRKRPPQDYSSILKKGYKEFGQPEYRPSYRSRFDEIRQKTKNLEKPSEQVLRDLRWLHYLAELDAAIDRLAFKDQLLAKMAQAVGVDKLELAKGIIKSMEHAARGYAGYPGPAVKNISRIYWHRMLLRQEFSLMTSEQPFPGVRMTTSVRRHYRYGRSACHLLGYVAPMSASQYQELGRDPAGLKIRDRSRDTHQALGKRWFFKSTEGERNWLRPIGHMKIGKVLSDERVGSSGLEQYYNEHLRGRHAYRTWRLRTSPDGQRSKEALRVSHARPGKDIRLTIDLVVQRAAERALRESGRRGAVVFMDPNDGGIMAMVSMPDFEPAVFHGPNSPERVRLLKDPLHPLINRAHQGLYPPGSVVKPLYLAAALECGALRPTSTFTCTHVLPVGTGSFECLGHHGEIGYGLAIEKSCNIFFYKTGLALERFSRSSKAGTEVKRLGGLGYWGRAFGFGRYTGVDLPGEKRGLMPSREWKSRVYAGRRGMSGWTGGDTCNVAIGQGATLVTPLQAAVAMAAIANGGKLVRPHLLLNYGGRSEEDFPPREKMPMKGGSRSLEYVRKAMVRVVNEPWGTGRRARMNNVIVAGKTGSAENPHGPTHAWFCGFAPQTDAWIAFAVLLENAGHGGVQAAPVARKVLEVLFPSGVEFVEEGSGDR
jgi:cell division protein FtsI/penicillin-binding protein 2